MDLASALAWVGLAKAGLAKVGLPWAPEAGEEQQRPRELEARQRLSARAGQPELEARQRPREPAQRGEPAGGEEAAGPLLPRTLSPLARTICIPCRRSRRTCFCPRLRIARWRQWPGPRHRLRWSLSPNRSCPPMRWRDPEDRSKPWIRRPVRSANPDSSPPRSAAIRIRSAPAICSAS